jgi:LmbE family N-acetylglucosaminyl deacetylase
VTSNDPVENDRPFTVLFLHAHPDDESILTGATLAKAADARWRTLVAIATDGDAGVTALDLHGQTLGERRRDEAAAALATLNVARVEFLGYTDSGMVDEPTAADAFSTIDATSIAASVADLFGDESIDIIVGYDRNGQYGHPDHHHVHRVGRALRDLWGHAKLIESTYHRDYLASLPEHPYGEVGEDFAIAAHELTHFVEGNTYFAQKVEALKHHASQVPDDFDTDSPDFGPLAAMFGTEWYVALDDLPDAALAVFDRAHTWSGAPPQWV